MPYVAYLPPTIPRTLFLRRLAFFLPAIWRCCSERERWRVVLGWQHVGWKDRSKHGDDGGNGGALYNYDGGDMT